MAVRYAENLMLFKSAAATRENKNKTMATTSLSPGQEAAVAVPRPQPHQQKQSTRRRVRSRAWQGSHPPALGDPVPQRGAGGLGESHVHPTLQKGRYYSNGSVTASLPSVWYNSVIFGWSQHVVWAWWLEGK